MAISITTQPNTGGVTLYQPAFRRPSTLVIKATSNHADIVAMRLTILINLTQTFSIDRDPDFGTTDEFTFDISKHVQDYLSYKLHTTAITYSDADETAVSVTGTLYEITDDGTGRVVGSGTAISAILAYNIARQFYESASLAEYVFLDGSQDVKFLTNAPLVKKIGLSDKETLGLIFAQSLTGFESVNIRFRQYDEDDNLINNHTVSYTGSELTVSTDIGVGTDNIGFWGQVILDNTKYYTVYVYVLDGFTETGLTELRRFDIVDYCDYIRFHFLNRFGRFDSVSLPGRYTEGLKVASKRFEKYRGVDATVSDRGFEDFNIEAIETFSVGSDLLSREDLRWLQEMKTSSQVYIENEDGFIPVIITNKSEWKTDSDNPEDFLVKYEYADVLEV